MGPFLDYHGKQPRLVNGGVTEQESIVARKSWKDKRKGQGFSYEEVLNEMKRRVQGEYTFDNTETVRRFTEGVNRLNRAYKLSALLHDFLDREGMLYQDLVAMTGMVDHQNTLKYLLDPVPRHKKKRSLRKDYEVHCFYPGADIPTD
jgi:hypothetical protein